MVDNRELENMQTEKANASEMDLQIPGYQIIKLLGKGGMGAVYLANSELGRQSALKILLDHAAQSPEFVERFIREAKTAARVEHPNILTVYTVGKTQQGMPFIEMQFANAGSLQNLVETYEKAAKLIPIKSSARIIRDAAQGLGFAHSQKVIHRDIKPDNILFLSKVPKPNLEQLIVKVSDFGLAKYSEDSVNLTSQGAIMGTPLYMSPEQCQTSNVDHRSDIYSLGAVLYRLLAGTPPFKAEDKNTPPTAIMLKHINDPLIDVRNHNPNCPVELAELVNLMMAKDASQRYQNCEEVADRLDGYIKGTKIAVPVAQETPSKPKKNYSGLIAALATCVAAAGLAIWAFAPNFQTDETTESAKNTYAGKTEILPEKSITEPESSVTEVPEPPKPVKKPEYKKPEPKPEPTPKVEPEPVKAQSVPELPKEPIQLAQAKPKQEPVGPKPDSKEPEIPIPDLSKLVNDLHNQSFANIKQGKKLNIRDFAKKYGYLGALVDIDQDKFYGKIGKKKTGMDWEKLKPEEMALFYQISSNPEDPNTHLGLFAYWLQNNDYQNARNSLRLAGGKGADIKSLEAYLDQEQEKYQKTAKTEPKKELKEPKATAKKEDEDLETKTKKADVRKLKKEAVLYLSFDKKTIGRKGKDMVVVDANKKGLYGVIHGCKVVDGVSGKALEFDGDGDYVDLGNRPEWNLANTDHSISLWFKANVNTDEISNRLISRHRGNPYEGYAIYINPKSNLIFECVHDDGGLFLSESSESFDEAKWHHVVVTIDVNKKKGLLYLDKKILTERSYRGHLINSNNNLTIGSSTKGSNDFNGLIDEIFIFHRILTYKEIELLNHSIDN